MYHICAGYIEVQNAAIFLASKNTAYSTVFFNIFDKSPVLGLWQ